MLSIWIYYRSQYRLSLSTLTFQEDKSQAHETRTLHHRIFTVGSNGGFQALSKWFKKYLAPSFYLYTYTLPTFYSLFSSCQGKITRNYTRVSVRCSARTWPRLRTKQRQHFIRFGCESYRREYIRGCFRTSDSQLVKWLRQPASRYSWGGKSASSSSRSCRALEITRISARVGINIEIFLWATNRHSSWEKCYPPVFSFYFPSEVHLKG